MAAPGRPSWADATGAPGVAAAVEVAATSANLGPGFDSLGLALDLVDQVTATVVDRPGTVVEVSGEGSGELATGEHHLVARTLLATLDELGRPRPPGLHLRCVNGVPHGRGLGSSAAAVVAGVLLARALAGVTETSSDAALASATAIEGHPDNAAAALLGGATIAWLGEDGPRAVRLQVHPDLVPLVLLPSGRLATHHARSVLPASVSHSDAAHNVARAALLVHALTTEPALLHAATSDRLHQHHRRSAMPATLTAVERLRDQGLAAVVSGAGPAVLVLSTTEHQDADLAALAPFTTAPDQPWTLLSTAVRTAPARARVLPRASTSSGDAAAG